MSKMTIKTLFVQRVEDYEGQFGPEVLFAIDEFTYDENPEVFQIHVEEARLQISQGIFRGMAIVDIKVDLDEIRKRCLSEATLLEGEID